MKRSKEFAMLAREIFGQKRVDKVCVMSRAEGYVMVRFPQAMPFVVSEKQLSPTPPRQETKEPQP